MEYVNEIVKRDEYTLVKQKGSYLVTQFEDEDDLTSKKILNNAQSKRLISYYINMGQKLREKYNKERIQNLLQSILNQQMYYKIIETEEANDVAKIGKYSFNSGGEDTDQEDFSELDESFDQDREIKYKIPKIAEVEEICRNIDHLVDSLLNIAIPGVESIQFSSTSSPLDEDTYFSKSFTYVDDSSYDFYIRLAKPEVLDKIVKDPLKIVLNTLHIVDEGFNKPNQFSYFNDLQNIFKKQNIELEVKNLQLNIYFKKRNQNNNQYQLNKFFENYKNFLKKNPIEMQWIYSKQILEVYLQFDDQQSKYIQKQINKLITNLKEEKLNDERDKLNISQYQVKIILHQPLNAAIVNDIKLNIQNTHPAQFIKKIYYSNDLKSNLFQFLGQNNNVAFIHTQQFLDSNEIKYEKYKFKKNNLKQKQHNQDEFDILTSNSSSSGSYSNYYDLEYDTSSIEQYEFPLKMKDRYSEEHIEEVGILNKYNKNKSDTRYNIFDIYKDLLEIHFTKQYFVFCSYDIHSQTLQNICKHLQYPLNLYQLIHSKTTAMLSIIACNLLAFEFIEFKPHQIIWDFYFE